MDGLISLIIWGVIISKIVKAVKGNDKKPKEKYEQYQRQLQSRQRMQQGEQRPVTKTTQAQRDAYYYNQQKSTKERLQQKYASQKKETSKSDILSRAKENVQENEMDEMQQQIHAEVCRDYRDTSHKGLDVDTHKVLSENCDTGEESDIIKKVNDLIVTGYSGDMNFERDFIAEGVDMLNRFTI